VTPKARGRPVGLGIDGTGALLIADDAGNTVWRVAAADGAVTDEPVPTDRIDSVANEDTSEQPVSGAASAEPPQTEIAPAVSPEDGAPVVSQ
jgi:hypothetical protein